MDHHYGHYNSAVTGVRQMLLLEKSLAERCSAVEPAGRIGKKKTANGCLADSLAVFFEWFLVLSLIILAVCGLVVKMMVSNR